jgi:hypothetical protein
MKRNFTVVCILCLSIIISALSFFSHKSTQVAASFEDLSEEDEEKRDELTQLRWFHEFNMTKDPVLNQLPEILRSMNWPRLIPFRSANTTIIFLRGAII